MAMRMGTCVTTLGVLAWLAVACESNPPANVGPGVASGVAPSGVVSGATSTVASTGVVGSTPAATSVAGVGEASTRAEAATLLAQWLKAQNEGDFAAYERSYAPELVGIKRAGTRETSFDREGWLKDRKRMFGEKMNVSAENVRVDVETIPATIDFVQTWQSGTFEDVGRKRLTLRRVGDAWRVEREEMLESKLIGAVEEESDEPKKGTFNIAEAKARALVRKLDAQLKGTKPEYIGLQLDGLVGNAALGRSGAELVSVRDGLWNADLSSQLIFFYEGARPFFVQQRTRTELGKGRARYDYRDYYLSDGAITGAYVRQLEVVDKDPAHSESELRRQTPKPVEQVVGNAQAFGNLTALAQLYKAGRSRFDSSTHSTLRKAVNALAQ